MSTKTATIREHISGLVRSRALPPGSRVGTEVDFARDFQMSRMTVRKAVDSLVSEGLIERRRGSGLFTNRSNLASKTIQMVLLDSSQNNMRGVIAGVNEVASANGLSVQCTHLNDESDVDVTIDMLRALPNGAARGTILRLPRTTRFIEAALELHLSGYPVVMIDHRTPHTRLRSVVNDTYNGGRLLADRLIELGHRKIAQIARMNSLNNQKLWDGVRDAMLDACLPFDRQWALHLDIEDRYGDWSPQIHDQLERVLSAEDRPTAILFNDDKAAAIGMKYLANRGVRVPEDISVVGFGDAGISEYLSPSLATLDRDFHGQGRAAMSLLLAALDEGEADTPNESMEQTTADIPLNWISGQSVASPSYQ